MTQCNVGDESVSFFSMLKMVLLPQLDSNVNSIFVQTTLIFNIVLLLAVSNYEYCKKKFEMFICK